MLKRIFDLLFSGIGLLLLLPFFAVMGLAIKLDSPGRIFYRGARVGRAGRRFLIYKFRTMIADAEKHGGSSTPDNDPRTTKRGRILRRYKLDELPQLINVFKGEMSFVGPRPQVQWAVDLYAEKERDLLSMRPGVTDYASLVFRNEGEILRGSADPDKDYLEKIAPEKIRLGLEYVRNHSLCIDLKIIFATVGALAGWDPSWCLPANSSATQSQKSLATN